MLIKEFKLKKDPFEIFKNFSQDDFPIFLDSQRDFQTIGRYSIIASEPFLKIRSKNKIIEIFKNNTWVKKNENPLNALQYYLDKYKISSEIDLPFLGGALGYFSYDLYNQIEQLNMKQIDDIDIYDMYLGFYSGVILIDNLLEKLYIIAHNFEKNEILIVEELEKKIFYKKTINNITSLSSTNFKVNMTKKNYFDSIEIIKENIKNGNVYQINFTQRFQCKLNKTPLMLYERLRKTNPAPFAAYLDLKNFSIVSSSPERFIKVNKNKINTRPIKGTIARGKTLKEDFYNENILKESIKDKSELLMIVDLERNDISKISKPGSVKVTELFKIEKYSTVFQQIANIEGELKENINFKDILEATFPGGSITGAPKLKAIELIGKLEKTTRNIYTGSIGYISFHGNLDLNIVIRTVLCKKNMAYYQVGGGIVWDSNAQAEYEESLIKGKALKEALIWGESL